MNTERPYESISIGIAAIAILFASTAFDILFTSESPEWFILLAARAASMCLAVALVRKIGSSPVDVCKGTLPWVVTGLAIFILLPAVLPRGALTANPSLKSALSALLIATVSLPIWTVVLASFAELTRRLIVRLKGGSRQP